MYSLTKEHRVHHLEGANQFNKFPYMNIDNFDHNFSGKFGEYLGEKL